MAYIIWLYLANISTRFRLLALSIFRLALVGLLIEHLLLATHDRPGYFTSVTSMINQTWIIIFISFALMLLPSDTLIFNILTLRKNDNFLRNSIFIKLLRLIKYYIRQKLLGLSYQPGWYQRLITPKRLKYIYILLYLYDLYKVYSKLFVEVFYCLVIYFGFAVATWLYARYTNSNIYYISSIDDSFAWGIAIISFLILKVLFFPNWKTIKLIGISILVRVIVHKFGLISAESKIDAKLEQYQTKIMEE